MSRRIVHYPHPALEQKAEEISEITEEIRQLAHDMAEAMYDDKGIGLAAPQVGESVCLIIMDLSGPEERSELMTLVNPRIEEREGEVVSEEGCLSFPELFIKIRRSEKVTAKGLNLEGEEVTLHADGMLAVCLQHEIDHLHGRVILDHASRLKRSLYEKKVKKHMDKG
jgi:peptide deformylase